MYEVVSDNWRRITLILRNIISINYHLNEINYVQSKLEQPSQNILNRFLS